MGLRRSTREGGHITKALVLSIALMGLASTFIARVIHRYRWIAYVGLLVILYVAVEMVWEGYHEVRYGREASSASNKFNELRRTVEGARVQGSSALVSTFAPTVRRSRQLKLLSGLDVRSDADDADGCICSSYAGGEKEHYGMLNLVACLDASVSWTGARASPDPVRSR